MHLPETEQLAELAAATGSPQAIIGTVDSTGSVAEIAAELDRQVKVGPVFRGIRILDGLEHDTPQSAEVLGLLAERGLVYDLVVHPDGMLAAARTLERLPHLPVVVEHTGWPMRPGDPAERATWEQGMSAFAQRPATTLKFSGPPMALYEISAAAFRPWFEHSLAAFGSERVLIGSNIPVDGLFGTLTQLLDAYLEFAAPLPLARAGVRGRGRQRRGVRHLRGARQRGVPARHARRPGRDRRRGARRGGNGFAEVADARDDGQVRSVFERAAAEFGTVDVVLANAGIVQSGATAWEIDEQVFRTVLDVNVVGSWLVLKHGIATMRAAGTKGSVVVIGSGASIKGLPNIAAYVASKHALVGLVRTAAKDAAAAGIRVNLIAPGNVRTPMFLNDSIKRMYVPDVADPSDELLAERAAAAVPMRVPWVEPEDVSGAVLYLASDAARYVTGTVLPVDAGSGVP